MMSTRKCRVSELNEFASNLNLPPGVSAPHGGMQCVCHCVVPAYVVDDNRSGYMLGLSISTSPSPISSRFSSPSASLSLLTSTETR